MWRLHLTQSARHAGQPDKLPMPIPLRVALFDPATARIMARSWWC
jgi:hypothetical protein